MSENSLVKALEEIKAFGYTNSGKGFSCAKMAEKALAEYGGAVGRPPLCEVFVAFSAFRQGDGQYDKYIQLSVDMETEEEAKGVIETYKTTLACSIKKPDYFIIMKGNKNFA